MIPLFIGGTGRSGTSILKRVIATHPGVASIPTELRVIVDPDGALDLHRTLTSRWSPYNGDIAVQRFADLLRRAETTNRLKIAFVLAMHRLGISPGRYTDFGIGDVCGRGEYRRLREALLADLQVAEHRAIWAGTPSWQRRARMIDTVPGEAGVLARRLERFFHDYFQLTARGRRVSHWVEDTPYNLLHVHELLEIFPTLRFIHVHRDFRDVVASYRRQHWGRGHLPAIAGRVAAVTSRWLEIRSTLPEEVIWEVGLAEIVADSQGFYSRFLEFSGLPPESAMAERLDQLDTRRMHGGRWRRDFSPAEVDQVAPILAPALAAYGYEGS